MRLNISPGPWVIRPLKGKYYGTEIQLGDGNQLTVWTPDHHADPFGSSREMSEGWEPSCGHDHVEDTRSYANAKLISMAPELLAIVRGVYQEYQCSDGADWQSVARAAKEVLEKLDEESRD